MSTFPYVSLAILVVVAVAVFARRATRPARREQEGADQAEDAGTPLAPLQKVAWGALAAGLTFVAAAAALVAHHGVAA